MHPIHTVLLSAVAVAALGVAASAAPTPTASSSINSNPFAQPSPLPLHAPPFNKIKDSDYEPAIEEGMKEQLAEMAKIANNPAPPTFENTIVEMEKSGQMLTRATTTFFNIVGANTNDTLDKVQTAVAPKLAAHQDAIFLNPKLFARVKAIYDQRDKLKLDPESKQLLKVYYNQFIHAGANLSEADKAKLRELNKQEATLSTAFQQKLLAAGKAGALTIDNKAELDGLSEQEIAALADAAKSRKVSGKWVIPLQNTTQQPLLVSLKNRKVRQTLFEHSWTRAEKGDANDTRDLILKLAKERAEKAKLLGYPNYAAYVLYDQMAKTPEAVQKFIGQLTGPTRAKAADEAKQIQAAIKADGQNFDLKPWDWEMYSEKVRKAKYDLDQNELKPYFELNKVLQDGVFYAANKLYGLTFKERKDLPAYQQEVRVFEVFDRNGAPLALFLGDYFARDNKRGGAWMDNLVRQSRLFGRKPVVTNTLNIPKPQPGRPALLSFDEVTTLFHEFGHAVHGMLSNVHYPLLSGTAVPRDFVEFPSQYNEMWAREPSVLANFAKHYQTGAPMPQELLNKVLTAQKFNQGYATTEYLAAALLDQEWHLIAPSQAPAAADVPAFEAVALRKNGIDYAEVQPRYHSGYFSHIFAGGYASGYYAYLWSEVLARDTGQWMHQHGGLTRANGDYLREKILSRGRTEDPQVMFKDFYGRAPDIGPLIEYRGLTVPGATKPAAAAVGH
jgi:peptidyl-dipeptidase Dcp